MSKQSELSVQLIKAISPKLRSNLGRLSWVAMIDEVQDSVATGRVLINASEDFRVPVQLNHQIAEKIGHLVLRDLPEQNYMITATGMAQLNEEIQFTLTRSEDGIWTITDTNSTLESGTRYDGYAIAPKELSIGPSSYRELLTNYDLISEHVKLGLKDYLNSKINIKGTKFKESSVFISPADDAVFKEIKTVLTSMSEATSQLLEVSKRLRPLTFIKRASDSDNGIDVSGVMGLITDPANGMFDLFSRAQSKMNKFRSSDMREAIGLTANAYYKDINDCLINIQGQIQSYNETFMFTKKGEDEEYKQKFLDAIEKNCINILEKSESLREQYDKLSN